MNALRQQRFNDSASSYLDAANLQADIASHLVSLIPLEQRSGLILDCGAHSRDMRTFFPEGNVIALDVAIDSLSINNNPETVCADFAELPFAAGQFDLIFSSMALHWHQDIAQTLQHWLTHLAPGGELAISLPIQPSCSELFSALGYEPFVFESLASIEKIVNTNLPSADITVKDFHTDFDSLFACLRYFKATGCHTSPEGLWSPRKIAGIQARYPQEKGRYPLSFRVAFLRLKQTAK